MQPWSLQTKTGAAVLVWTLGVKAAEVMGLKQRRISVDVALV